MLALAFAVFCWYGMQAVHELGHAITAVLTGGRVERIVLPIAGFSRTDLAENPRPLLTAWAGPIAGGAVPLLAFALLRVIPRGLRLWLIAEVTRSFAGFCLIANGAYIGLGWIDRIGDAGDLLRLGAPVWSLCLVGAFFIAGGLLLWHRGGILPRSTPSPPKPAEKQRRSDATRS